jgi:uncharacterized protein YndB with AHSA1/START domain
VTTATAAPAAVVDRFINATPERIWNALTRQEELQRWFFTEVKTDPRRGGNYDMWWRSEKEPERDHRRFGKYLDFDPFTRLSFEWRGDLTGPKGLQGMGDTVVTITLTPEGAGTRLRLVHTGWNSTDAARKECDGHQRGWTFFMDNLASVLESGNDRRAEFFGQHTCAGQS